jgi:hypothetical protein
MSPLLAAAFLSALTPWQYLLIAATLMLLSALIELAAGRRLISASGRVRFWAGDVRSPENSQQFADWYSFTHILHGFILYAAIIWLTHGAWPLGLCFLAAVFLECCWEVLENSRFIINRYRQTMAQGYAGDTVLNSMSDILFASFGFALAHWLPVWLTITLLGTIEAGLVLRIRDNLTLNVIMLIYPFPRIKHWQTHIDRKAD